MSLESLATVLSDGRHGPAPTIAASAYVAAAIELMHDHDVDALIAMNGNRIAGVFTTRDIVAGVLVSRRDVACTRLSDVLRQPAISLPADANAFEALRCMDDCGCHHVAVDRRDHLPCILSRRDLTDWIIRRQQEQLDCAIGAVRQMGFTNRRG